MNWNDRRQPYVFIREGRLCHQGNWAWGEKEHSEWDINVGNLTANLSCHEYVVSEYTDLIFEQYGVVNVKDFFFHTKQNDVL